jgi:hypothetical protein
MLELSPALIICMAIGIVMIVNAVLIIGLIRGRTSRSIEMAREAFKAARNPWAREDEALEELSRRVKELPHNEGASGEDA